MMVARILVLAIQQPRHYRSIAPQTVIIHIRQLVPRSLFVLAVRHTSSTVRTDYTSIQEQINVIYPRTHSAFELENGMKYETHTHATMTAN